MNGTVTVDGLISILQKIKEDVSGDIPVMFVTNGKYISETAKKVKAQFRSKKSLAVTGPICNAYVTTDVNKNPYVCLSNIVSESTDEQKPDV